MLRVTLGLLTASTIASAQPTTLEGRQRELVFGSAIAGDAGISTSAFAQLSGGTLDREVTTDVAAGLDVRVSRDRCDVFRIGGQGRIGWREGAAQTSAEQWASFCAPLEFTHFDIGHRLEWDVRPSLLAPLGMRPGKNRRETINFHWRPVRITRADIEGAMVGSGSRVGNLVPPPPGDVIIFDVDWQMTWLWSSDGDVTIHGLPYTTPFGYSSPQTAPWGEARDFRAALTAGGEFAEKANSVFVWFGELDNLVLGPMFVSAGVGIVSASAGEIVSDYTQEVDLTSLRAKAQIETGTSNVHGYLKAANDLSIAPDGYVVADRRVSSGVSMDLGRTRLALDGTFGRGRAYVPRMATTGGTVGGGALSVIRELSDNLRASVQVEVARSFYAGDEASQLLSPRWGARAFGVLQAVAKR